MAPESLTLLVAFSEGVQVPGSSKLRLNFDGHAATVVPAYSSGTVIAYQYVVAVGDNVATLDYADTTALFDGAIADTAGNPATIALAPLDEKACSPSAFDLGALSAACAAQASANTLALRCKSAGKRPR